MNGKDRFALYEDRLADFSERLMCRLTVLTKLLTVPTIGIALVMLLYSATHILSISSATRNGQPNPLLRSRVLDGTQRAIA